MRLATIKRRKLFLLALLAISSAAPMLFVQYEEPSASLLLLKVLAKVGSLIGTTLLVWQIALGFRGISTLFHEDVLWLVGVHEKAGTYGILLILLHPIFISVYYAKKYGHNVFALDLASGFSWFVLLGMLAIGLLIFIFVTSALFRKDLGYGPWFATHITTWFVLPLVFVHSFPIGMTLRETGLSTYWLVLAAVTTAMYAARIAHLAGWRSHRHEVVAARKLAKDIIELRLQPLKKAVDSRIGQFVYVRRGLLAAMRPYTVSDYNKFTGEIAVTVKALGTSSSELQEVRAGEMMVVDGPYGVFSREALENERPLVMAAGGIGITAFMRLARHVEERKDRAAWLFYGNKDTEDIVYKTEVDAMKHVKVVHVISDEPEFSGEKGNITLELIRKYVDKRLPDCEFLICGPPAMTESLEEELTEAGVPASQIHHELFGF